MTTTSKRTKQRQKLHLKKLLQTALNELHKNPQLTLKQFCEIKINELLQLTIEGDTNESV